MSILQNELAVVMALEIHYGETRYEPGGRTETVLENEETGEKACIRVETDWNGETKITEKQAW